MHEYVLLPAPKVPSRDRIFGRADPITFFLHSLWQAMAEPTLAHHTRGLKAGGSIWERETGGIPDMDAVSLCWDWLRRSFRQIHTKD